MNGLGYDYSDGLVDGWPMFYYGKKTYLIVCMDWVYFVWAESVGSDWEEKGFKKHS